MSVQQALDHARATVAALEALQAGEAAPATVAPAASETPASAPQIGPIGLTDAAAFFVAVRGAGKLWPSMTEPQVAGVNAILDACAGEMPLSWTAYVLATARHETGGVMTPNVENLNYSVEGLLKTFGRHRISETDARRVGRTKDRPADQRAIGNLIYGGQWGRENLGNTEPNDGYDFRGRAWPHITGRRNYQRADDELGLGGSLVANPDRALELPICAALTVRGMKEGWFTGKALRLYIPAEADLKHYRSARQVINGVDKADQIAEVAEIFEGALKAGGWR